VCGDVGHVLVSVQELSEGVEVFQLAKCFPSILESLTNRSSDEISVSLMRLVLVGVTNTVGNVSSFTSAQIGDDDEISIRTTTRNRV
jgi:hypothetical protein